MLIVESVEPGARRQPLPRPRARRRRRAGLRHAGHPRGPRDGRRRSPRPSVDRPQRHARRRPGAAGRALGVRRATPARACSWLLGERSSWPDDAPDLLPGRLGAAVDRSGTSGRHARVRWTTAIRCSRSSPRLAAATSPPRACSAIAR
ncbi:MAG: hypothetical protein MZU95_01285 [Desulfomicrobium escambiense]|nr:hypothetical protein [Desulfomicrobium escambiense]